MDDGAQCAATCDMDNRGAPCHTAEFKLSYAINTHKLSLDIGITNMCIFYAIY